MTHRPRPAHPSTRDVTHVPHTQGRPRPGILQDRLQITLATWLVDDGVPVNMVQRVMGHERSSTTLDLYTRRTDDHGRILQALDDDDDVC